MDYRAHFAAPEPAAAEVQERPARFATLVTRPPATVPAMPDGFQAVTEKAARQAEPPFFR
jgi:hypothetical protein